MMMDDDVSVSPSVMSVSAIPKCCCSWKNCRSYQKTLRDKGHPTLNGALKFRFEKENEKDMALKAAFDRILDVQEDRREKWKDGVCKYFVARHHFTEDLIKESIKSKKTWKWNETLSENDANLYLWELDEQGAVKISDTEMGYLKVPNVPKDHVKEIVKTLKGDEDPGQSLEGMLTALVGGIDDDDAGDKRKKKKKDEGSVVSSKSKKDKKKKDKSSDDASAVSTKSKKDKKKDKDKSGDDVSVASTTSKRQKKRDKSGDDVSVASTASKKEKKKDKSSDDVSVASTKSKKDKKKKDKGSSDDASVVSTKSKKDKKKKSKKDSSADSSMLEGMLSSLPAMDNNDKAKGNGDDDYDAKPKALGDNAVERSNGDMDRVRIEVLERQLEEAKLAAAASEKKIKDELDAEREKSSKYLENVSDLEKQLETIQAAKTDGDDKGSDDIGLQDVTKFIELEQKLQDAESRNEDLEKQLETVSADDTAKFIDLEQKLKDAGTRNTEQRRELDELRGKLEAATQQLEEDGSEDDLKVKNYQLQVLVDELTERKGELEVENETLMKAKEDLESKQNAQNELLESELIQSQTKITELEREIEVLKESSANNTDDDSPKLQEANALNEEHRETIDKLRSDMEEAEHDNLKETMSLKATLSEYEEREAAFTAELEESKQTAISLRKLICELQETRNELTGKVAALERENAALAAADVVNSRRASTSRSRALASTGEQKEDITLEEAMERLANQQRTIRELEATRRLDDSKEARAIAEREDELEKGTALLANIYNSKSNLEVLSKRGSRINHVTGEILDDPPEDEANEQFDMLESVLAKKETNWWPSRFRRRRLTARANADSAPGGEQHIEHD